MKGIVLAAGYATRLYPLTLNKAKALLPVGGMPIINYTMHEFSKISEIDKVYVVTNNKFYKDFCSWQKNSFFEKEIVVLNDGTNNDSDKLGAIGDIDLVLKEAGLDDDIVVVAGDNLFEFELKEFVTFFRGKGLSIACYRHGNRDELHRYGIVELDGGARVSRFYEKPKEPKSDLVAIGLYGLPRNKLFFISEYLERGHNKDAPGYYIQWLVEKENVHAFVFEAQWHDIGTPEAYERAGKEFDSKGVILREAKDPAVIARDPSSLQGSG